jgi:protein-disulfide isomerase
MKQRFRPSLGDVTNVVLIVCAAVVTAALILRWRPAGGAAEAGERVVQGWRDLRGSGHLMGDSTAPVWIVEFADFQCPYCAQMAPRLDSLRRLVHDSVAVVFHHYPLAIHPEAFEGALAAECAGAQGRFGAFYHTVYHRQRELGAVPWTMLATAAGVPDTAAFSRCLSSAAFESTVRTDQERGDVLGVQATPTFLLDSLMVVGAVPTSKLVRMVRHLMH